MQISKILFVKVNSKKTEKILENLVATQIGKVVIINGYCTKPITDQRTVIGQLTKVGLPAFVLRTVCNVGSDAYSSQNKGYFSIETDGTICVRTKSGESGTSVYVSCSYCID